LPDEAHEQKGKESEPERNADSEARPVAPGEVADGWSGQRAQCSHEAEETSRSTGRGIGVGRLREKENQRGPKRGKAGEEQRAEQGGFAQARMTTHKRDERGHEFPPWDGRLRLIGRKPPAQ